MSRNYIQYNRRYERLNVGWLFSSIFEEIPSTCTIWEKDTSITVWHPAAWNIENSREDHIRATIEFPWNEPNTRLKTGSRAMY